MDDESIVRAHVRAIVSASGFDVVGEATAGDEVVPSIAELRPDVILMDLGMPRVDGFEALRRVRELPDAPPCLALTTSADAATIDRALAAGAAGYLVKTDEPETWTRSIREVLTVGAALSPTATKLVVAERRASGASDAVRADAAARLSVLTDAERRVVAYVTGRTNAEIAPLLYMSEHTVKSHVSHALAKLGLRRRSELAALAQMSGIVVPPQP